MSSQLTRLLARYANSMDPFIHLNSDVLNIILSLLSPSDADKLARTCRAAYRYAIPRILSDVTLGLGFHRKPKSQLASFCHFVLPPIFPKAVHRWFARLRRAHTAAARAQAAERLQRIREMGIWRGPDADADVGGGVVRG